MKVTERQDRRYGREQKADGGRYYTAQDFLGASTASYDLLGGLPDTLSSQLNISRRKKSKYEKFTESLTNPSQSAYFTMGVSAEIFCAVTELVQGTWQSKKTGRGRDTRNLEHTFIVVKRVEAIKNEGLLERYKTTKRQHRLRQTQGRLKPYYYVDPTMKKPMTVETESPVLDTLNEDINEQYLFHGTKSANIPSICAMGPDFRIARKGMFGRAIYLSESATKADQYADEMDGRRTEDLQILICRVLLGNAYYCEEQQTLRRSPCVCGEKICRDHHETFDSVIGDTRKLFREFLLFTADQCYPEYIVTYDRIDQFQARAVPQLPLTSLCLRAADPSLFMEEAYKDDVYQNCGLPRGRAVIVNNINFQHHEKRDGSEMDCKALVELMEQMSYTVIVHNDLTAQGIFDVMETESKQPSHWTSDSFIVFILSHGMSNAVYGTDGYSLPYSMMYMHFTTDSCPALAGKPKMFFIQACQGTKKDSRVAGGSVPLTMRQDGGQSDSVRARCNESESKFGATMCDIAVATATTPDYVSWRNKENGSWFINAIVRVFSEEARSKHFLELLTSVNSWVASMKTQGQGQYQQVSSMETMSFTKRFYFWPRLCIVNGELQELD
ncbi:uncharacterized protein LOC106169468 [Lingula anatina]|uniref:Poly [ADP-ribose] polymerase n=1 Tax=Lingula anatina TaxID=7574 RepID=A0A1S3J3E2_LINAN|nr:uncharacterized protein LOC106169468 [Lingula anatina]|eukprot:XP_013404384.1 uncharacterized protein LOC106169468 [Lingula anatina]